MKSITIIGHIGQDATTKEINGSRFVDFPVAVNEQYVKGDGSKVEATQWFSCTTKRTKLAPFLKKGDQVMVEGNFTPVVYQNKEGQWMAGINVRAFNIQFLSPKKDEEKDQGLDVLRKLIQNEVQTQVKGMKAN